MKRSNITKNLIKSLFLSTILILIFALPAFSLEENIDQNVKDVITQQINNAIPIQDVTTEKIIKVTKVILNKKTLTLNIGDTETLVPTITPINATNKNLTWKSNKPLIATVDSNGKIIALKEGKVVITVTNSSKKKATCNVTVTKAIVPTIKSIANITKTINQGDDYSLPKIVETVMSDGSINFSQVTWNPSTVDTSKVGTFSFEGTVDGYNKKVKLTLIINEIKTGSIKGNITWQYNRYIGTKPDVGARIALIPKNLNRNLDNSFFAIMISQIPQGKYGIYTAKADGYGSYEIDDIPTGQYYLLIVSKQTTSDMTIYAYDKQILTSLFSDKDWKSLELNLKLNKYDLNPIEIKKDKTLIESHDFGYTYF